MDSLVSLGFLDKRLVQHLVIKGIWCLNNSSCWLSLKLLKVLISSSNNKIDLMLLVKPTRAGVHQSCNPTNWDLQIVKDVKENCRGGGEGQSSSSPSLGSRHVSPLKRLSDVTSLGSSSGEMTRIVTPLLPKSGNHSHSNGQFVLTVLTQRLACHTSHWCLILVHVWPMDLDIWKHHLPNFILALSQKEYNGIW